MKRYGDMSLRSIGVSGIPFVALSVYLVLEITDSTAEALASTLMGVAIALAIFAVNFSFVAFQLAPYRRLRGGPSGRHVLAAILLVGFGLTPLLGTTCSTKTMGQLAAFVTPLLAYGAILLVALGLAEAEPKRVLATCASDKDLNRFALRFQAAAATQIQAFESLDYEADLPPDERLPPPSHEIFHRVPPPPLRNDPLEMCVRTAAAAVQLDDATVFVPAVERLLTLGDNLRTWNYGDVENMDSGKIAGAAASHGEVAVQRVTELVSSDGTPAILADRFIDAIARYTQEAAFDDRVTSEAVEAVFMAGIATARRQTERKTQGAGVIGLLLAARKVSDQTLRALRGEPDTLKEYSLAAYPTGVRLIGEAAIQSRDSDLLFRCLEALSWIGCVAVRFDGVETGRRAAGGLVQLGRLARHADLECHWPRCSLTPYQHAIERLKWMATWIPRASHQEQWLESLGVAFARLEGYERKLRMTDEPDEKTRVELVIKEEPHRESFFADGGERTLDYSDESMLKDQALR